jgi:hypothetical protein
VKYIDIYRKHLAEFQNAASAGWKLGQKKVLNERQVGEVEILGYKPGGFAEACLREAVELSGLTFRDPGTILKNKLPETTKKRYLLPDGYIPELDCYLESKNYSFGSQGTANEKLFGFLFKLSMYDKPCILVFAGEHELKLHDECKLIWSVFHDDPIYKGVTFSRDILEMRDAKKLFLANLSTLSADIPRIKRQLNR